MTLRERFWRLFDRAIGVHSETPCGAALCGKTYGVLAGGIVTTEEPTRVTCKKCLAILAQAQR